MDVAFILVVIGAAAGIAAYVHTAMKQVREALPAQVLEQQRDVAYVVNDLAGVLHALERAQMSAAPGRIEAVLARVRAARRRLHDIRRTYNFDNLVGASAVHAIAYPALLDIELWATKGLSGHPPDSPAVLELMRLRARNAYERVTETFDQTNRTAVNLIESETARLGRFRDSLFLYLGAFAALAIGISVLFVRQRNAEARLALERKRLVDSVETIGEGFALYDADDRLVLFNRRFSEIVPEATEALARGLTFESLMRRTYEGSETQAGRSGARLETWLVERMARHRDPHGPFEVRLPDGCVLRVNEQRTADGGTVGVYSDVTDQKRAQERLEYLATHDFLTGLPNRSFFSDRIEHAIARSRRNQERFAVMFFDLDHFKRVNDTLGHESGDRLLQRVGVNLQNCLRGNDTVVRLGGDEFAAVVENVRSWSEVASTAERALKAVREAVEVGGAGLVVTTSIGIAMYPEDGTEMSVLMRNADVACYHAKDTGRDTYQFYTERLNTQAAERVRIEQRLRAALERDALVVHYRPQVDLVSGELASFEAIVGWRDPDLTGLAPARILSVAEECGLALDIGERMLESVCEQARLWAERGLPRVRLEVSLTPRQFRIKSLARVIRRLADQAGIEPERIAIRIDESTVVQDPDRATGILDELHVAGHRILVGNFGAGGSSLSVLKELPLDGIEIDRSFVRNVADDAADEAIVCALVAMAHELRLRVVADGVDTPEQVETLLRLGCDEARGGLFGDTVEPDEAARQLELRSAGSVTPITRGPARRARSNPGESNS